MLKSETRNERLYKNLEVIMGTTSRWNKHKHIAGAEGCLFILHHIVGHFLSVTSSKRLYRTCHL